MIRFCIDLYRQGWSGKAFEHRSNEALPAMAGSAFENKNKLTAQTEWNDAKNNATRMRLKLKQDVEGSKIAQIEKALIAAKGPFLHLAEKVQGHGMNLYFGVKILEGYIATEKEREAYVDLLNNLDKNETYKRFSAKDKQFMQDYLGLQCQVLQYRQANMGTWVSLITLHSAGIPAIENVTQVAMKGMVRLDRYRGNISRAVRRKIAMETTADMLKGGREVGIFFKGALSFKKYAVMLESAKVTAVVGAVATIAQAVATHLEGEQLKKTLQAAMESIKANSAGLNKQEIEASQRAVLQSNASIDDKEAMNDSLAVLNLGLLFGNIPGLLAMFAVGYLEGKLDEDSEQRMRMEWTVPMWKFMFEHGIAHPGEELVHMSKDHTFGPIPYSYYFDQSPWPLELKKTLHESAVKRKANMPQLMREQRKRIIMAYTELSEQKVGDQLRAKKERLAEVGREMIKPANQRSKTLESLIEEQNGLRNEIIQFEKSFENSKNPKYLEEIKQANLRVLNSRFPNITFDNSRLAEEALNNAYEECRARKQYASLKQTYQANYFLTGDPGGEEMKKMVDQKDPLVQGLVQQSPHLRLENSSQGDHYTDIYYTLEDGSSAPPRLKYYINQRTLEDGIIAVKKVMRPGTQQETWEPIDSRVLHATNPSLESRLAVWNASLHQLNGQTYFKEIFARTYELRIQPNLPSEFRSGKLAAKPNESEMKDAARNPERWLHYFVSHPTNRMLGLKCSIPGDGKINPIYERILCIPPFSERLMSGYPNGTIELTGDRHTLVNTYPINKPFEEYRLEKGHGTLENYLVSLHEKGIIIFHPEKNEGVATSQDRGKAGVKWTEPTYVNRYFEYKGAMYKIWLGIDPQQRGVQRIS